mmetsp:Transcript_10792/g.14930  ORF Transcript_10792/g.14930 Transcript_10792/m.14930 type:complete len:133 (+) Transcript_10792:1023-1421(+)
MNSCRSSRIEWNDLRHHPPGSKKVCHIIFIFVLHITYFADSPSKSTSSTWKEPSNDYTMPRKGAWGSTTNLDRYMIKSKQETTKAIGDGDTVVTSLWEAISNLAGAVNLHRKVVLAEFQDLDRKISRMPGKR